MKYIFLIFIHYLFITSSFALQVEPEIGLRLEFQIDEDFLICHTLSKVTDRPFTGTVMNFRKEIMNQFPEEIKFLSGVYELTPSFIFKEHLRLEKMLKAARVFSSYPQLLAEAKTHLEQTRSEWTSNYERTFSFMTSLTKLKMSKTIKVLITHPEVFQGRYLEGNGIAWGRKSNGKNYSTVYLWHEILHSYLKYNNKTHALMELVTDDALRVFLNGGTFPPFSDDGHEKLKQKKQWIYDHYWKAYLANNSKNILQLEDDLIKDLRF